MLRSFLNYIGTRFSYLGPNLETRLPTCTFSDWLCFRFHEWTGNLFLAIVTFCALFTQRYPHVASHVIRWLNAAPSNIWNRTNGNKKLEKHSPEMLVGQLVFGDQCEFLSHLIAVTTKPVLQRSGLRRKVSVTVQLVTKINVVLHILYWHLFSSATLHMQHVRFFYNAQMAL